MPRPRKCRKVCRMPVADTFTPNSDGEGCVVLAVDEYECIRLIDYQNFSQEQCAAFMQVSRATAQLIYDSARKKLAEALVKGCSIRIEGGDFRVCSGEEERCECGGCEKHYLLNYNLNIKGDNIMRIAITYENGQIFQHFGHTEQFKIYDVEDGKIISKAVVSTDGQGHGALAAVLQKLNADVVICGGIGGGAQMALAQAGIRLFGGVSGSCDQAAEDFVAGKLGYDPNVRCDHHGHGHDEGHSCADHDCGGHTCGGHSCH